MDDVARVWGPETVDTTGSEAVLLASKTADDALGVGVIVGAVVGGVVVLIVLLILLFVIVRNFCMLSPEEAASKKNSPTEVLSTNSSRIPPGTQAPRSIQT